MIVTMANPKFKEFKKPYRYKIVYGGRAGGKSVTIATLLLLMGLNNRLIILCVREVKLSLSDSVLKLFAILIQKYKLESFYTVQRSTIIGKNGTEIIFKGLKANTVESLKSIVGINICWIEEGQSVSMRCLDLLIPCIREEGSEIWVSFNRYFEKDPVYVRFVENKRPNSVIIKTNYYDVSPDLLSKEVLIEAETDKKADYNSYLHVWEGEPLQDSEKTWLSIRKLREAVDRQDVSENGKYIIGVDVARYGDDRTVFFKRKGLRFLDYKVLKHKSIIESGHELKLFCEDKALTLINIDDTGVGGGLTDYMRSEGYMVNGVNFGGSAKDKDKYNNKIGEMWGDFKGVVDYISLPDNPDLLHELNSRYYSFDHSQRFAIEPKKSYKKRIGKSPDLADALLLCFMDCKIEEVDYQELAEMVDDCPNRAII